MLLFEPLKAKKLLWGQGGSTGDLLAWPHHRAHWDLELQKTRDLFRMEGGSPSLTICLGDGRKFSPI